MEILGCQLCLCKSGSISAFRKHIKSPLHKKKMEDVFQKDTFTNLKIPPIITKTLVSTCADKQPNIDLSLLTLCFSPETDKYFYLCHVCEDKCSPKDIAKHLLSVDHFSNYFSYTDPNLLSFSWMPSMEEENIMKLVKAKKTDKKGTRHLQMLDLPENLLSNLETSSYAEVLRCLSENDKLLKLLEVEGPKRTMIQTYQRDIKRKHPLLGIQHIVRCIRVGPIEESNYLCTLCQLTLASSMVIKHVLSFDHIFCYLDAWHPCTLLSKESYKDYSAFACEMLDFAKQSEKIHSSAETDLKQVRLQPDEYASVNFTCYKDALQKLEFIRKKKEESSLITIIPPGNKLEPQVPAVPVTSTVNIRCQNCSTVFTIITQFFKHMRAFNHQQTLKEFSGGAKRVGGYIKKVPHLKFLSYLREHSHQSQRGLGVSLIVMCISPETQMDPFCVCFACSESFPEFKSIEHCNSLKHLIQTLLYLNPWRLPVGWETFLGANDLRSAIREEEKQRGQNQTTIKIIDAPLSTLINSNLPSYPQVLEAFKNNLDLFKSDVPLSETHGTNGDRFPRLGRQFLVSHDSIGWDQQTGVAFVCLLCERRLPNHEFFAHDFSRKHIKTFLDRFHPGSLSSDTDAETLCDLAKQAQGIHGVTIAQELTLVRPIWDSCSYKKVCAILTKVKRNAGQGGLTPLVVRRSKLVPSGSVKDSRPENGKVLEDSSEKPTENCENSKGAETKNSIKSEKESLTTITEEIKNDTSKNYQAIKEETIEEPMVCKLSEEVTESCKDLNLKSKTEEQTIGNMLKHLKTDPNKEEEMKSTVSKDSPDKSENNSEGKEIKREREQLTCLQMTSGKEDKSGEKIAEKRGGKPGQARVKIEVPEYHQADLLRHYLKRPRRECVIGLDAATECRYSQHNPIYLCECCSLKIPEEEIISHVTGVAHQKMYLLGFKRLPRIPGSQQGMKIRDFASLFEKERGHGDIKVVDLSEGDYNKILTQNFESSLQTVKTHQAHEVTSAAPDDSQVMHIELDLDSEDCKKEPYLTTPATTSESRQSANKCATPTGSTTATLSTTANTSTTTASVIPTSNVTPSIKSVKPASSSATPTIKTVTPSPSSASSTSKSVTPSSSTATPTIKSVTLTPSSATPTIKSVSPSPSSANPTLKSINPTLSSATPTIKSVTPTSSSATPTIKSVSPSPSSATPAIKSVKPACSSATPTIKSINPTPSSATPKMKSITPASSSATPTIKSVTPTPSSARPTMKSITPTPSSATPTIKSATPTIKSATPTIKSATPTIKSATPTIKSATPTIKSVPPTPSSATTTPIKSGAPTPSSATPTIKSATPTIKSATPTIKSATPTIKSAPPTPSSATTTPIKSGAPTPCSATPTIKSVTSTPSSVPPTTKSDTLSTRSVTPTPNSGAPTNTNCRQPAYKYALSTAGVTTTITKLTTANLSSSKTTTTSADPTKCSATTNTNSGEAAFKCTSSPFSASANATSSATSNSSTRKFCSTGTRSIASTTTWSGASTNTDSGATTTISIAETASQTMASSLATSKTSETSVKCENIPVPSKAAVMSNSATSNAEEGPKTQNNSAPAAPHLSTHVPSNKNPLTQPSHTYKTEIKPQKKSTPKVGIKHLIEVLCGDKRQIYCRLCSCRLRRSGHLLGERHKKNYVNMKLTGPWSELSGDLDELVVQFAEAERKDGPQRSQAITVKMDTYNELAHLPDNKAFEKLIAMLGQRDSSFSPCTPNSTGLLTPEFSFVSPCDPSSPDDEMDIPRSGVVGHVLLRQPVQIPAQKTLDDLTPLTTIESDSPGLFAQASDTSQETPEKKNQQDMRDSKTQVVQNVLEDSEKSARPSQKYENAPQDSANSSIQTILKGEKTTKSSLSRFLKVKPWDSAPFIGLDAVWECQVMPKKASLKTFFLCESCCERLFLRDICQHMISERHLLNHMWTCYPQFMDFWEDKDLQMEMKLELTKDVARMLFEVERYYEKDAQSILLAQHLFEKVQKAPFNDALEILRNPSKDQNFDIPHPPISTPRQKAPQNPEKKQMDQVEQDPSPPAHTSVHSEVDSVAAQILDTDSGLSPIQSEPTPQILEDQTSVMEMKQMELSLESPSSYSFSAEINQTLAVSSGNKILLKRKMPAVASVETLTSLLTDDCPHDDPEPAKRMCRSLQPNTDSASKSTSVPPVATSPLLSAEDTERESKEPDKLVALINLINSEREKRSLSVVVPRDAEASSSFANTLSAGVVESKHDAVLEPSALPDEKTRLDSMVLLDKYTDSTAVTSDDRSDQQDRRSVDACTSTSESMSRPEPCSDIEATTSDPGQTSAPGADAEPGTIGHHQFAESFSCNSTENCAVASGGEKGQGRQKANCSAAPTNLRWPRLEMQPQQLIKQRQQYQQMQEQQSTQQQQPMRQYQALQQLQSMCQQQQMRQYQPTQQYQALQQLQSVCQQQQMQQQQSVQQQQPTQQHQLMQQQQAMQQYQRMRYQQVIWQTNRETLHRQAACKNAVPFTASANNSHSFNNMRANSSTATQSSNNVVTQDIPRVFAPPPVVTYPPSANSEVTAQASANSFFDSSTWRCSADPTMVSDTPPVTHGGFSSTM